MNDSVEECYWAVIYGQFFLAGDMERATELVRQSRNGWVEKQTITTHTERIEVELPDLTISEIVREGILSAHPWIRYPQ